MIMNFFCKDCKYYLPVDVFKGICKISKNKISPDDSVCNNFEKQKKCKFCKNFSMKNGKEFIGKCCSNFDAYPDMNSKTCTGFIWLKDE